MLIALVVLALPGAYFWVAMVAAVTSETAAVIFLGEDTEFASGFSQERFALVRVGMTPDEVVAIAGEPLRRWYWSSSPGETWAYSRSPSSSHFRQRSVLFESGRVVEVVSRFYVD